MKKKSIDVLLVIALLAGVGYIVFLGISGGISHDLVTPTETSMLLSTPTSTETAISTFTLTATQIPASATVPVPSPSSTPLPTQTSETTPTVPDTATATGTTDPAGLPTLTATLTPTQTAEPTQSPTDLEVSAGTQRGDQIVQALEAYHSAVGQYPPTLSELVPGYLPAIPVTITGQQFFYRLFEATGPMASEIYWLSFKVVRQDHVTCTYLRRLEYWDCNYQSP